MSAANFPGELSDELVFEGGWSDNPADPGGATNFGITLATLTIWLGRQATIADLKGMSVATRTAIYHTMFWRTVDGDGLPSGLDLVIFDMSVNGGPPRAAKMIQDIVSTTPDGDIGPKTIAAITAYGDTRGLISLYTASRQAFYRSLPQFPTFGTGWLARVAKAQTEAFALLPA